MAQASPPIIVIGLRAAAEADSHRRRPAS